MKCNVKISKSFPRKVAQSLTCTGGSARMPHKKCEIASRAKLVISVQHWPAPSHHLDCLLRSVLAQSSQCSARSQTFLFYITSWLALIACFVNVLYELWFCFLSGDSILPFGHQALLSFINLTWGCKWDTVSLWNSLIFLLWWHLEHTRKRQHRSSSWYREPMLWYETNDMEFTPGWGLNSISNLF